jgi:hypothetical protein
MAGGEWNRRVWRGAGDYLDDGQQLGGKNKGDPDSLKRPEEPMLNAADIQFTDWLDLDKNPAPLLKDEVINRFYQVEREAEENGIPEKSKKYPVDHPQAFRRRVVSPIELENKGEQKMITDFIDVVSKEEA